MSMNLTYIGDVEVSMPEGVSQGRELTDAEGRKFNSDWRELQARFHANGKTDLFGDDIKNALKTILGIEAKKRSTSYEGRTPQDGLGMHPIHVADVTGWDAADGYTDGLTDNNDINFAAAGWATLWGAPVAGAGAIARGATADWNTHRQVVGADFNNNAIMWATVLWGVQDNNPAPKVTWLRMEQGREVVGDHNIEDQMRGTELRYADLGRMYYFSHPQPFAIGGYIKALINNAGLGVSSLKFVGVTIAPALRLRQLTNNVRNRAAIV